MSYEIFKPFAVVRVRFPVPTVCKNPFESNWLRQTPTQPLSGLFVRCSL